ncbi:MAG: F0F1 ATP synthase subunit beta, partial [Chloroflexota bacterium]
MAEGRVAQIIGTVVDVEFPPEQLPALYNAVEIHSGAQMVVAEVQQHVGNNWVRCLAMDITDGLKRGDRVVDTGAAISVPVGPNTLGRLFNVLGQPLDTLGAVESAERWPIHRAAPAYEDQETKAQMLETGIKV